MLEEPKCHPNDSMKALAVIVKHAIYSVLRIVAEWCQMDINQLPPHRAEPVVML